MGGMGSTRTCSLNVTPLPTGRRRGGRVRSAAQLPDEDALIVLAESEEEASDGSSRPSDDAGTILGRQPSPLSTLSLSAAASTMRGGVIRSYVNKARFTLQPTFVELASRGDELEKPNCDTPDALWGDDDEQFDLGLEKWGVNIEELKKPLGPHRVFKCWVEDWENVMDKGMS
ncbi:hypothetical protein ACHAW5_003540 [Stephanodiscus triporus]|uniref:Uncharacterized protein n=1 Tax=Stephanodiscus triporus TaxID=2934178 RepID=A0ABD3NXX5_9STRA